MKIKDGFILREFRDEFVAVAIDDEEFYNKLITMSSTGAFVYKMLESDVTEEEIVKSVLDKYDVTPEIARADVDKFLSDLKNAGLIDE